MRAVGPLSNWGQEDPSSAQKTYSVDQDDQVVGLHVTAGIISHSVVVADQGPVDGVNGESQGGLL